MINFACIESQIFVGSAPQSIVDLQRLQQMGISSVLSLQTNRDFETHRIDWEKLQNFYQSIGLQVHRFPIKDFDESDMGEKLAEPIKQLNTLLLDGKRVYVHCNAGICRAPATILGYLCNFKGMTLDEGLSYIRDSRPQANPYISAVKSALRKLRDE